MGCIKLDLTHQTPFNRGMGEEATSTPRNVELYVEKRRRSVRRGEERCTVQQKQFCYLRIALTTHFLASHALEYVMRVRIFSLILYLDWGPAINL